MKKQKRSAHFISIVLPCLNEGETVADCVAEARRWLGKKAGEVVVVDNGSTDDSVQKARRAGARVVREKERGYGAALRKGLKSARGAYVLFADADMSYDLRNLTPFVSQLRAGADIVVGNRFLGKMEQGAMPWLHKYIGNPFLTFVANTLFHTRFGDYHCGIRAMRKEKTIQLRLRSRGMEFASEMLVKSALRNLKITEIPVNYRRDGRSGRSHLRSFRDGWRHLKFLMLYSPNWVFLYPSFIMMGISAILLALMIFESIRIGQISFGIHTMLVSGMTLITGHQLFQWSLCSHLFSLQMGMSLKESILMKKISGISTDKTLLFGSLVALVGLMMVLAIFWIWSLKSFGNLDAAKTLRVFIPGIVLITLGVQTIFSSLFLELLRTRHS